MNPNPIFEKSFIFNVKNPDCLHHVKSIFGKDSTQYKHFLNGEPFRCSTVYLIQEALIKKGMRNPHDFTLNKVT